MKHPLIAFFVFYVFPALQAQNREEQLRKEFQIIVAARESSTVPQKERQYSSYLSLCTICRDSTEARRRLREYEGLRQGDKALFEKAKTDRSADRYEDYLRNCFYCEDSAAAKRWISYHQTDVREDDSLAWKECLQLATIAGFQKYLDRFVHGKFRKEALKKINILERVENWKPEMAEVKGGRFTMGAVPVNTPEGEITVEKDGNEKAHEVKVHDFWLDKYEVSFDLYDLYCEDQQKSPPADNGWGRRSRPVINITWYEAVQFCNWLSSRHRIKPYYTIRPLNEVEYEVTIADPLGKGYRLPTEAEWEYAAKIGSNALLFASGSNYADMKQMNFNCAKADPASEKMTRGSRDCINMTQPVNSLVPKFMGFYHQSGNVGEWCWDGYQPDYKRLPGRELAINPEGDPSTIIKVYKGGSWSHTALECRSSARKYISAQHRRPFIGFRLAKN